jgi:hypothetical protein
VHSYCAAGIWNAPHFYQIYLLFLILIKRKLMKGLNRVTLIGNLGNEPEYKTLQDGTPVGEGSAISQ